MSCSTIDQARNRRPEVWADSWALDRPQALSQQGQLLLAEEASSDHAGKVVAALVSEGASWPEPAIESFPLDASAEPVLGVPSTTKAPTPTTRSLAGESQPKAPFSSDLTTAAITDTRDADAHPERHVEAPAQRGQRHVRQWPTTPRRGPNDTAAGRPRMVCRDHNSPATARTRRAESAPRVAATDR